ncbi:galanin receptor 2a-like [Amphiura filiformis]|uniref:galanin receptor 2a-like n=1 Tax=Amphiura filiformis TaxID=82378 RepID=UPI003B22848B
MEYRECDETFTINVSTDAHVSSMEYNMIDQTVITVLLPFILLFGIISNVAFLFVIIRVPWMRTITNTYLASIAVADIVFLLVGVGEKVLRYRVSPVVRDQTILGSSTGCVLVYFIIDVTYFSCIFLVTFVSYERYLAVCYPIKYRIALRHKSRPIRNVIIAWMAGVICSCITIPGRSKYVTVCVLWPENETYCKFPKEVGLCTATSSAAANIVNGIQTLPFFISLLINTILYIRIVRELNPKRNPVQTSAIFRKNIRNQVAIMLVITGIVFFLCLAPFETLSVLQMLSGYVDGFAYNSDTIPGLIQISRVLMYINSATNSVIYVIASTRYRKAFRQVFNISCFYFTKFDTPRHISKFGVQNKAFDIWTVGNIQSTVAQDKIQ